jgi:hypothetical protein
MIRRVFVFLLFLTAALPAARAKDACQLITADDVKAALGTDVQKAPPTMLPPSSPGLEYSMCRFKAPAGKATVSLLARYATSRPNDSIPDLIAQQRAQKMPNVREVKGVGDGAMASSSMVLGKNMYQLTFYKGKYIFLLITIDSKMDDAAAERAARALAAKILPRA